MDKDQKRIRDNRYDVKGDKARSIAGGETTGEPQSPVGSTDLVGMTYGAALQARLTQLDNTYAHMRRMLADPHEADQGGKLTEDRRLMESIMLLITQLKAANIKAAKCMPTVEVTHGTNHKDTKDTKND